MGKTSPSDKLRLWHTLAIFLVVMGCEPATSTRNAVSSHVVLMAASSTADVMAYLADAYQAQTGVKIVLTSAGTQTLARQIMSGAPADIFVCANRAWQDELKEHGHVRKMKPLLRNRLVLAVPDDDRTVVQSIESLVSDRPRLVALASEYAPLGQYAEQSLRTMQLYERLLKGTRIVRGRDAAGTRKLVESGEVDAAILYASDMRDHGHVRSLGVLRSDSHDEIIYPLLLLANEKPTQEAALAFYRWLDTTVAHRAYREFGFEVYQDSGSE
ncbi:MAG: molybdate ABC transporter substrate-binding protein [Phycisphaerae bacterium]